nr:TMV resistance protein N-like isoform X1 [Ipomoea batatas]GMD40774.1 TMV resistance protein N-like isoform X1 [Ipomoea batatas]GMD43952.1 TMV resistance protein N-like isoform X1 [Ipomoea batatas]GMD45564.1 TMV resistance protein N-like isoform X1 [Ipomoea batatas]GMD48419.1 TMV resistance protein N-like isoform X1 [Ipomoea batatas]
MRFGGVLHTDFSESIKEVLKCSMNSNGLLDCNKIPGWIRSNIDLYDYGFRDIKAGEVIKATPITEVYEGFYRDRKIRSPSLVEASVVKKIGVEALYRDKDGSLQLLPLTKVG